MALTLVGIYFVIFPIQTHHRPRRRRAGQPMGAAQRSGFMGYDEKPFDPNNDDDPWDHIDYIKPTFKQGAHPYVAQLSKSAEWADPLRHLPVE